MGRVSLWIAQGEQTHGTFDVSSQAVLGHSLWRCLSCSPAMAEGAKESWKPKKKNKINKLEISCLGRGLEFVRRKMTLYCKCLHEWVTLNTPESKFHRIGRGKMKFCSYSPRNEKAATVGKSSEVKPKFAGGAHTPIWPKCSHEHLCRTQKQWSLSPGIRF